MVKILVKVIDSDSDLLSDTSFYEFLRKELLVETKLDFFVYYTWTR